MPIERQLELLEDVLFHGNNKGILEIEDKGLSPKDEDDPGGETYHEEVQDTEEDTPSEEMPEQSEEREETAREEIQDPREDTHCEEMPDQGEGEGEEPQRSGRNRIPTKCPFYNLTRSENQDTKLSKTVEEALRGLYAAELKAAMAEEIYNMQQQKTWEVVKRLMADNVLVSKWVFAIKRGQCGKVVKYKARVVAQGFC
jgi:hypothetical protein